MSYEAPEADARRVAALTDLAEAPRPATFGVTATYALSLLRALPYENSEEGFWHTVREILSSVRMEERDRIEIEVAAYLRARCSPWGPWQMRVFRAGLGRLGKRAARAA